ncbi:MAG: TonB family protein [Elusimicrobiota bacterium]|jgi:TonB family protein
MSLAEHAFDFFTEAPSDGARMGKPLSCSITVHALLALLLPMGLGSMQSRPAIEPVRVWEIKVMGTQDLSLKGSGHDASVGPRLEKILATPPKQVAGPERTGAARVADKVGTSPTAPREMPRLAASGPIFGRSLSVAESGVGRDKIYTSGSAVRLPGPSKNSGVVGERLAGGAGDKIDLNPRRGVAGVPGGTGRFLGGGLGSLDGGNVLQRKGEAIVVAYNSEGQAPPMPKHDKFELPDAPDTFFSIRGPLSRRKIVNMTLPKYPRWAEEAGVEAQISLRLYVTPNGVVKPEIWVEQTSGFPEFDEVAKESVRSIKFVALGPNESPHEEWGVATFNFKLKKMNKRGL